MSNHVTFWPVSVFDTSTVACSSSYTTHEPSHVLTPLIRNTYQANGKASEYLTFNLGSSKYVQGLFIAGHNFSRTATVQWKGMEIWTTGIDPWSIAPNVQTLTVATDAHGDVVPRLAHITTDASAWNAQYFRLYVNDANSTSERIEIGRVYAVELHRTTSLPIKGGADGFLQMSRNIVDGYSIEHRDTSVGDASNKQGFWSSKAQYRKFSFQTPILGESQAEQLEGLWQKVGTHTPFVMSIDPVERPTHNTHYVQFAAPVRKTHVANRTFRVESLELEEKT